MKPKPYIYCLLIEVDPSNGQPYLGWLLGGHIEVVAKNPGFLSGRITEFNEPANDGWLRYMVVYEVESKAALEAYWQSDTFKGYGEEAKEFAGTFRITRLSGETVLESS